LLDRHPEALVGREFILDQPITQGFGRIRVNDTIWRVRGTDQPSGAKVRVRQVEDGVLLIVDSV
jgi:membrane protein implicated in regulation of membrane protease activity